MFFNAFWKFGQLLMHVLNMMVLQCWKFMSVKLFQIEYGGPLWPPNNKLVNMTILNGGTVVHRKNNLQNLKISSYNVRLRLILQYCTMFKGLLNFSKNSSSKLSTLSPPHLISGGDKMLFYLQCINFVSDLVFYCNIGNNSCCLFQTRCCICLVWSFLN